MIAVRLQPKRPDQVIISLIQIPRVQPLHAVVKMVLGGAEFHIRANDFSFADLAVGTRLIRNVNSRTFGSFTEKFRRSLIPAL